MHPSLPVRSVRDVIALARVLKALDQPDVRERLTGAGAAPTGGTPEAFGAYFRNEVERFGRIVTAAGLKLD